MVSAYKKKESNHMPHLTFNMQTECFPLNNLSTPVLLHTHSLTDGKLNWWQQVRTALATSSGSRSKSRAGTGENGRGAEASSSAFGLCTCRD